MAAPRVIVDHNTPDKNATTGSDQRASSWVTCFIRYTQPAANYTQANNIAMSVIRNDVVAVNIENSKSSFGKICNLTMKSTDIFYPTKVNPGDWCFVWMHDNLKKTYDIANYLATIKLPSGKVLDKNQLINENSGLKFAGRVIGVSHNDIAHPSGPRTITQTVTCQSFLEFATSVYYTRDPKSLHTAESTQSANGLGSEDVQVLSAQQKLEALQFKALDEVTKSLYDQLKDNLSKSLDQSPDRISILFYVLIMGVKNQEYIAGLKVNANTAIEIPSEVARIFGKPKATHLPDIINVYGGLQEFGGTSKPWYKNFVPKNTNTSGNIKSTGTPTKGFVPLRFELWNNMSLWDILGKYLNPVCNEMYTSLKVDHNGHIRPSFTIREKPFSTGLFNKLKLEGIVGVSTEPLTKKPSFDQPAVTDNEFIVPSLKETIDANMSSESGPLALIQQAVNLGKRTMYGNLPRWVISENMVRSFSYKTNEANRVNFVQVWGASSQENFLGVKVDHNSLQSQQLAAGNFYFNQRDISRNGLRAYIVTSTYDVHVNAATAPSLAQMWAKMNADWLFNGHLKVNGTLTTNGIQLPIAEGDNLEYRGLLFHIESVSHNASISQGGQKQWTTTLGLSNGLIAASLNNPDSLPLYQASQTQDRNQLKWPLGPGMTEFQDFNEKKGEDTASLLDKFKGKLV